MGKNVVKCCLLGYITVLMNLQQPQVPESQHSSMDEDVLASDGSWTMGISFLQGCGHWQAQGTQESLTGLRGLRN